MDRRLLTHYNTELHHLRHTAAEFARAYPKIAGRLALDPTGSDVCADPFVERLLEGFAFLTARVQVKMDAEFPVFTQGLLETVYPHYLSPTPSMTVVQFTPAAQETALAAGFTVPRGTVLRSSVGRGQRTACEFRTAHEVGLWPIAIAGVDYLTRELGAFALPPELGIKAVLRLRLKTVDGTPFAQLPLDRLSFYLPGADETPDVLYEQVFRHAIGVVPVGGKGEAALNRLVRAPEALRAQGFSPEEALLPDGARSFTGYRLLREYFAFRQRFLFFELRDLRKMVVAANGPQLDLLILLGGQDLRLENRVDAGSFALFCTPAINLFEKRLDRIPLSGRVHEYQVIPDRTRPFDYEVFSLDTVTGYGAQTGQEQAFEPFYLSPDRLATGRVAAPSDAFYATRREPRHLTARERQFGQLSAYLGSEMFVSLVDLGRAPYRPDVEQLGVKALCTNRHLPLGIEPGEGRTDFTFEMNVPVDCVRCLTHPTAPRAPLAQGAETWRLISHLSLNYFSFAGGEGELPNAHALREMLGLYVDSGDRNAGRLLDGVLSTRVSPALRRLANPGPITFGRGFEVEITLDEAAFEGVGVFVFGAIMARFLSRYVGMNSFTETVIQTQQRRAVMRWPAQTGARGAF